MIESLAYLPAPERERWEKMATTAVSTLQQRYAERGLPPIPPEAAQSALEHVAAAWRVLAVTRPDSIRYDAPKLLSVAQANAIEVEIERIRRETASDLLSRFFGERLMREIELAHVPFV